MISRILKHSTKDKISACRAQQETRNNYYKFLANKQAAHIQGQYEFSSNAIDDLKKTLDFELTKVPYGWGIPQVHIGISNIIRSFIKERNVPIRNTEHISI